jgi:hypothetical protein
MAETTAELDTSKEEQPGANGKVESLELDDFAFTKHIASIPVVEEVVEVPEWGKDGIPLKVLCKPIPAPERLPIHQLAYDKKTNTTDYRRAEPEVVIAGCYNPTTGNKAFRDSHRAMLLEPRHGSAVERLFFVVMRLSNMLISQQEKARKN